MELTSVFKLKKPADADVYNVQDFNDNMDVIERELSSRPTKTADASKMEVSNFGTGEELEAGKTLGDLMGAVKLRLEAAEEKLGGGFAEMTEADIDTAWG